MAPALELRGIGSVIGAILGTQIIGQTIHDHDHNHAQPDVHDLSTTTLRPSTVSVTAIPHKHGESDYSVGHTVKTVILLLLAGLILSFIVVMGVQICKALVARRRSARMNQEIQGDELRDMNVTFDVEESGDKPPPYSSQSPSQPVYSY
ncbi:hypothetical protein TWF481_001430 [Arthrobotrys musiformis]|uniref:Uncharacterized protein n=1 Tax=Arthrobotrys musiformis TaxID=47236 RepID=A0AAV9WRZ0_9PEZI